MERQEREKMTQLRSRGNSVEADFLRGMNMLYLKTKTEDSGEELHQADLKETCWDSSENYGLGLIQQNALYMLP